MMTSPFQTLQSSTTTVSVSMNKILHCLMLSPFPQHISSTPAPQALHTGWTVLINFSSLVLLSFMNQPCPTSRLNVNLVISLLLTKTLPWSYNNLQPCSLNLLTNNLKYLHLHAEKQPPVKQVPIVPPAKHMKRQEIPDLIKCNIVGADCKEVPTFF